MLFRKQALEHQQQRIAGSILLAQPVAHWIYTLTAVIAVSLAVFFLFWGTYARKVRVQGYLLPTAGVVQVYPDHAGTVVRVKVKDGEAVAKGTPLLVVSMGHHLAGGGTVGAKVLEQLRKQQDQIKQRIDDTRASQTRQEAALKHHIAGLKQEIAALGAQYGTQRDEYGAIRTLVQRYRRLYDQGYLSQADLDQHHFKYLAAKAQAQQTFESLLTRKDDLTQSQDKLEALPVDTKKLVAQLRGEKAQIMQQMITTKEAYSYVLRAPVAGQVTNLQAHAGQAVRPNALLLSLVPSDSRLQAYLYVPTQAIGFVDGGQSVQLQYRAFPHERYGSYSGKIVAVSDAILKPTEVPAPLALKKPVYRLRVALDSQTVTAYGKSWPLQPGMLLDADIILSHHSLIEWILTPLYSLKGRL